MMVLDAFSKVQSAPFLDKAHDGYKYFYMPDFSESVAQLSLNGEYQESVTEYTTLWDCMITGLRPILLNNFWADYGYITITTMIPDPVTGELVEFTVGRNAVKYAFSDEKSDQGFIRAPYPAFIPEGFKIKFHYFTKKTSGDPIKVIVNWDLHQRVLI
jgi:hypothetical protein